MWSDLCAAEVAGTMRSNEEHCLTMALSRVGWLKISMLPEAYAAHEIDEVPETAVIVHQSAYDEVRKAFSFWRWVKGIRRGIVSKIVGKPYLQWKYRIPGTS